MNTKEKAKAYVEELLSQGVKEIRVKWDGGNDEGSYYLYADGEEITVDYYKKDGAYELIDFIGDEIGYGSFAGDFNAIGEVIYDVEEEAFKGEDDCETSEEFTYNFRKPLVFTILKDLWFDNVEVDFSGYDSDMDVSVRLNIENGPVFQEHIDFELNAVNTIKKAMDDLFEDVDEVRDFWFNKEFGIDTLEVDSDGNHLLALTEVHYTKYVTDIKDIFIQL